MLCNSLLPNQTQFFQANSHSGDVLHTNNENSGDSRSSLSVASLKKGSNEEFREIQGHWAAHYQGIMAR